MKSLFLNVYLIESIMPGSFSSTTSPANSSGCSSLYLATSSGFVDLSLISTNGIIIEGIIINTAKASILMLAKPIIAGIAAYPNTK